MKKTLFEKAITPTEAASRGLALHVGKPYNVYVLYDAAHALELFEKYVAVYTPARIKLAFDDAIGDSVVASMQVRPNSTWPQWGVSSIIGSAAEKGYGPLLYDIVMAYEGGLCPDRGSVSAAARRVWAKYYADRPDVEHRPLDDADDPHTPDKRDDSAVYSDEYDSGEPLDYAYFIKSAPNVAQLLKNDASFAMTIKKLAKKHKFDVTSGVLELAFSEADMNFFDKKYDQ